MAISDSISDEVCLHLQSILKEKREAAGLSLNALSKLAGLDRTGIGFVEKGQRIPTLGTLIRVASALGIAPSVLLNEAESRCKRHDWKRVAEALKKESSRLAKV